VAGIKLPQIMPELRVYEVEFLRSKWRRFLTHPVLKKRPPSTGRPAVVEETSSGQKLVDHRATHVGQPEISSLKTVG
jgi:hypothetical protein